MFFWYFNIFILFYYVIILAWENQLCICFPRGYPIRIFLKACWRTRGKSGWGKQGLKSRAHQQCLQFLHILASTCYFPLSTSFFEVRSNPLQCPTFTSHCCSQQPLRAELWNYAAKSKSDCIITAGKPFVVTGKCSRWSMLSGRSLRTGDRRLDAIWSPQSDGEPQLLFYKCACVLPTAWHVAGLWGAVSMKTSRPFKGELLWDQVTPQLTLHSLIPFTLWSNIWHIQRSMPNERYIHVDYGE